MDAEDTDPNREEKLRAAKEKLKKFREKRNAAATPPVTEMSQVVPTSAFVQPTPPLPQVEAIASPEQPPAVSSSSLQSYFAHGDTVAPSEDQTHPDPFSAVGQVGSPPPVPASAYAAYQEPAILEPALPEPQANVRQEDFTADSGRNDQQQAMEMWKKQYEESVTQGFNEKLLSMQEELSSERSMMSSAREEIDRLKVQLASYKESTEIMVAEKCDQTKEIAQYETLLRSKEVEVENASKRASDMEKALLGMQSHRSEPDPMLVAEVSRLEHEVKDYKILVHEKANDVSELQSRLVVKDRENEALEKQLAEKSAKLEMAELNLVQIRSASTPTTSEERLRERDEAIARLEEEKAEMKKREEELTAYIRQAGQDREQIIQQYTAYGQQLTAQITSLTEQLNARSSEAAALSTREAELVKHVEGLERTLQEALAKQKAAEEARERSTNEDRKSEARDLGAEMDCARRRISELEAHLEETAADREDMAGREKLKSEEVEKLSVTILERDALIGELETQVEMLKSATSASSDLHGLMASSESDKVAASRAMAQNHRLKDQLEELQMRLIELTNNRAEVVNELDRVQRQQQLGPNEESSLKMEVQGLQEVVNERDRTIEDLRKQMKYYVAFAENSITGHPDEPVKDEAEQTISHLQDDLEGAKEQIRNLTSHNSELRSQLEVLCSRTREGSSSAASGGSSRSIVNTPTAMSEEGGGATSSSDSSNGSSRFEIVGEEDIVGAENASAENANADLGSGPVEKVPKPPLPPSNVNPNASSTHNHPPVIGHDVAYIKMEQKLKDAMNRIAELTNEKESLEHVNIQLQEETETVGEYITIYQYQRQQIRKRMEEKENQLTAVSLEREELKSKLSRLQSLVTTFMKRDSANAATVAAQVEVAAEATNESVELEARSTSSEETGVETPTPLPVRSSPTPRNADEARQILALISEIGSNQMLKEDFHPWFWEPNPAKLMTV